MKRRSTKQDGRPAMMFFPKDWLTDMGLQNCSIGARGLWFEILCYMFFSPKRGYFLLPNGKVADNKTITKLIRNITEIEIDKYIKELEENEVFSRLPNGTIYCRRMAEDMRKDLDIKNARSWAGKKGMAKRWHNKIITPVIEKGITKHITNTEDEYGIESFNKILVNNLIKESKKDLFNKIWERYPNKDGKKKALKYFMDSVNSAKDWDNINIALRNYLKSKRVAEGYIKNGSTWFNDWSGWVDFQENGYGDGLTSKSRRSLIAIQNAKLTGGDKEDE